MPETILIADDEASIRDLARLYLEKEGFRVRTAEDGVAAQTEQVIRNLRAVLAAAGTDLAHVVKTTVFLQSMGDFAAMNAVYARHFLSLIHI